MWNSRLDMQGLLIKSLQFLIVLLLGVHLYLEGVDLQQLRPLLHVVLPLLRLAGQVQLLQDTSQTCVVPAIKAELPQLKKG